MNHRRNHVLLAVAASLGLHGLLLLLWALAVLFLSSRGQDAASATPPPLKLTLEEETPPPVATPEPTATPTRALFKDTASMAEVATPPPDAQFESMKNTAAASELPGTGDGSLPTQTGRIDPNFVLETTEYVAGNDPGKAAPANTPAPETAPPLPRAMAQQKPPATPPIATAAPTPAPRPGDFALATPASLPTEPQEEPNPFDPAFRPPSTMTEPPLPTPVRYGSSRPAGRPQQLKTAISGSINNQGAASIASASSPMGRYQGAVINAIRLRWNAYIENRADLASLGSVKIHFLIGMDGKARGVQVLNNSANQALASITIQAIADAKIPPMPAEAVPDTGGGQLPMDITFEFLDIPSL